VIEYELRQRGWLYVTLLCALALLTFVWFKFHPPIGAYSSGPRCSGAVCLVSLEDNTDAHAFG